MEQSVANCQGGGGMIKILAFWFAHVLFGMWLPGQEHVAGATERSTLGFVHGVNDDCEHAATPPRPPAGMPVDEPIMQLAAQVLLPMICSFCLLLHI